MSLSTAFDVYIERQTQQVMAETWGHLAPTVGIHEVEVLFAVSCYENNRMAIIDAKVGDLPDSPWLFENLYELLWDLNENEPGVYRFKGTYRVFKNVKSRWQGVVEEVTS